jgi:hypothetical protein
LWSVKELSMLQSAQTCPMLQSHAASIYPHKPAACCSSASSILLSYHDCCTPMLPTCFIFTICYQWSLQLVTLKCDGVHLWNLRVMSPRDLFC